MNVTPKTKRQLLGELIAAQRASIPNMTRHHLGDKARVTDKIIERWERGDRVPTNQEWQRLRAVFPPLDRGNRYRELFEAAAAEQFEIEQARKDVASVPVEEKQGDLDAAVNMLLDAVAGLRSLRIEVDDDGHAVVTYVTREVRVVEDSGTMQVRRR